MRLLILTQAVDCDDPILGFFHRWVEELARRCDRVSVICLREGKHQLPDNVHVYSLGKASGASRMQYLARFYRSIWSLRKEYDSVFVHMNQEYVILGWKLWWLWGKRIVLWRNHKKGSWLTGIAVHVAQAVCYTSPEAYVAKYKNSVQMPIGVDTDFFAPGATAAEPHSLLFLGRLDPVKNVGIFIAALERLSGEGIQFKADIYGDPTPGNEKYAEEIRSAISPALSGKLKMHNGVTHDKTRDIYRAHAIFVNLTPSGSFDKTIGEAMASGCVVVASNNAVKEIIGKPFVPATAVEPCAHALGNALAMTERDCIEVGARNRSYIEEKHSLSLLTERLMGILSV